MQYVFVTPGWFFGYSILLEAFFAIITMLVAIYAFKIYRLSEERTSKLFGFSFLFISFAYIVQFVLNFLIWNNLDDDVSTIINLKQVYLLNLLGSYAFAFFFIIGLVILTYMTLKVKDTRVLALLLSVCIIAVYFNPFKVFMFFVLSSVLLLFTVIHYFINYLNNKKINTLIVLVAMIFLLFGTLHFMFAVNHEIYYVLAHILEFIAYMLILINLILILKHGQKKR